MEITEFDVSKPSVARIYDYLLGGKDNWAADRVKGEELARLLPDAVTAARDNRAFLQRVVRQVVNYHGIHQIIDIGTGLPTARNVHEVAGTGTNVAYVDNDPIVAAHARALLEKGNDNVRFAMGDLRDPAGIFNAPEIREVINTDMRVAVLILATMHFIPDHDEPREIMRAIISRLAPGSIVAISHATNDQIDTTIGKKAQEIYDQTTAGITPRSREELLDLFGMMEIMHPGVVNINHWPTPNAHRKGSGRTLLYGGLAFKR